MHDSDSPGSDSDYTVIHPNRTVFVCGFVSKRWHNSALQVVIHDLTPHYYVACNGENWHDNTNSRELLANADALLFFVNEFTLRDNNCLLTLQYAWNLMVPIIMLRPPRTKLVICKRDDTRDDIMVVGNGSIVRSPSTRWALLEESEANTVDYGLLQDVLYEGYKMSVVYDRLDHSKSMIKVNQRLEKVLKPTVLANNQSPMSDDKPAFFLSPSNNSSSNLTVRSDRIQTRHTSKRSRQENIRLSQSMINLSAANSQRRPTNKARKTPRKIPPLVADPDEVFEEETDHKNNNTDSERQTIIPPPTPTRYSEGGRRLGKTPAPSLSESQTSSIERRMSMSSLDDVSGYQQTQYLVFPLGKNSKKPTLVKFPEDLLEEQYKDGSVWGSDTSLEEEAAIATKITAALSIDVDDEPSSPIQSPAPYMDPL